MVHGLWGLWVWVWVWWEWVWVCASHHVLHARMPFFNSPLPLVCPPQDTVLELLERRASARLCRAPPSATISMM